MDKESKARKGFVKRLQFEQLRDELPENLRPFVTFLYETGCRTGAAEMVIWPWVNLEEGIIELPPGVTKNNDALTLPLSTDLVTMLKKRFKDDSPVFDTTNFRKQWNRACVKIGLGTQTGAQWYHYKGIIPHDLRRSAIRNLIRAGVDQVTAMSISGHRTVSTFQRYNIVDVEDKKSAMKSIEQAAKKEVERFRRRSNAS